VGRFVLRRLLLSIPVLLAATIVVFALVSFRGDPLAERRAQPQPATDVIRSLERQYHLDDPRPVQYLRWLRDFVRGDWGTSFSSGRPVRQLIGRALPGSLVLLVGATVLTTVAAVTVGVAGAVRHNTAVDHITTGFAFAGVAMPIFWFGLLLQLGLVIFPRQAFGVRLFYLSGMYSTGRQGDFVNLLQHLALPAATLAVGHAAALSRFQRDSMLDVLPADFVRTARAKGVSETAVVTRHALRNALLPLMTLSALQVAALVGGAIVTERIFAWPGMGTLFLGAIASHDYPVVLSWMAVTAVSVVMANLLADIASGLLDPRVRLG